MSDTPQAPFAPFQPASPPIVPETPETKSETPKQKAAREKREAKAAAKAEKPDKAPRQRAAAVKAHSPKFDLQTTLAAAQLLNESDFPLFEQVIIALDEAGKPARDRVLAAIGKVFG